MTENNDRKQFNLKLVLKEIIQPKIPTIALVVFLNFIFFYLVFLLFTQQSSS